MQPPPLDSATRRNNPAKTHLTSRLVSFQLSEKWKSSHEGNLQALPPCPDHSWWALGNKPAKAQTLGASCQCEGGIQEPLAPSNFLFGSLRELQRCTAGKCHIFKSRLPAGIKTPGSLLQALLGWLLLEGLFMCLIKLQRKPKTFLWEYSADEQLKGKSCLHIHQWDVTKDTMDVRPRRLGKKLVSLLFSLAVSEPPAGTKHLFSSWIAMARKTCAWGGDPKWHKH